MKSIDTIIFDFGGVLINWDPRYLYRKIFSSEGEMNWFLSNVCTPQWNALQDGGRSYREGLEVLIKEHPSHAQAIRSMVCKMGGNH